MVGFPSIFNDVIGPVMRGPSSSHCAGALRIGRVYRDLMRGLLGWEATDKRLPEAKAHLGKNSIHVEITIRDIGALHTNTYQLTLNNPSGTCQVTALSVGGGMIEIIDIDGAKISLAGVFSKH